MLDVAPGIFIRRLVGGRASVALAHLRCGGAATGSARQQNAGATIFQRPAAAIEVELEL